MQLLPGTQECVCGGGLLLLVGVHTGHLALSSGTGQERDCLHADSCQFGMGM